MLSLGVYPDTSLANARAKLADARRKLAEGIDPSAERQAERRAQANSLVAATPKKPGRLMVPGLPGDQPHRSTAMSAGAALLALSAVVHLLPAKQVAADVWPRLKPVIDDLLDPIEARYEAAPGVKAVAIMTAIGLLRAAADIPDDIDGDRPHD